MNSIIPVPQMVPASFDSWRSYFAFSFAREFADRETGEIVQRQPSRLEKIGASLAAVLVSPLDAVMREFRNPLVIVALTATVLFFTSIVFYPVQTMAIACRILPFLKYIHAGHIKGALYVLSEAVILGLGLRTVGRLSNADLMRAYREKRIIPIPIGSVRIPV
jgi:hypothetical protein